MMDILTTKEMQQLVREESDLGVTLMLPTHPQGSEEDRIKLKNLLTKTQENLEATGMRSANARDFLNPIRRFLDDTLFWKHQSQGLAFFLSDKGLRHYRLPMTFTEIVTIGKHFHVKPLLPLVTGNGRFFVLAISQNQIRLLQGTAFSVEEIDVKGAPKNLAEALKFDEKYEPLNYHTRPTSGGGWGAIFSGQGVGIDDAKDDLLRYFQMVDRGLHDLLREEHAPLILASVEYLQPIYQQANKYAHLLKEGITGSPDRLSNKELHQRAWQLVEPLFNKAKTQALAQYNQVAGTGRTTHDLERTLQCAYEGSLETLFIAQDRECWGNFDAEAEMVTLLDTFAPGAEDLLNLSALHTLRHGGSVYVCPSMQIPNGGLIGGVSRVPLGK